jgi:hypothetical protein
LQGNQWFGTLSVRRKNPMSSKGCWTLRRKADGVTNLEAVTVVRVRFPLGYIVYIFQFLQFELWRMHSKCLTECLNEMIMDHYDELLKEEELDLAVMVSS